MAEVTHSHDALLASEEHLAAIISTAMDGILTATGDQRIVSCNPAALEMFGYRECEVINQPLEVLMPQRFHSSHGRHVERFGRSGETRRTKESFGVLTARRKDGTEFPIEASVSRFQDASGRTLFAAFVRDISERVQAETALREALMRESARAEREALVNQIGEAVRGALEPAEVLAVTVETLGKALQADRCYYVTYDLRRDLGRIEYDWHRSDSGLSPLVGEFPLSNLALNLEADYQSGQTQVVDDVHEHRHEHGDGPDTSDTNYTSATSSVSLMDTLGLRSLIRAPLLSSGVMTALVVAMADGPRRWTEDEVRLVETVAAQTRAAVEAARVQQRERTIAQQLQDALQPPPPPSLPGLALEGYYKPALEEAGVGGDFFDVFPIEKGCTALVVGDLSGKGLAAASEVATVRNMVRYALYSNRSIAEAITGLNYILVEHRLLSGFTTLFVGVYDQNERTLTYVNCGQEPGLLWRAKAGEVEPLPPTGPVLGGFESPGGYGKATVFLAPGDVLALFTDGMTEVGPSRKDLLEIDGLTALFARCCAAAFASDRCSASNAAVMVKDELVARVEAHAGVTAGRRDDIALLIGVARQEQDGE